MGIRVLGKSLAATALAATLTLGSGATLAADQKEASAGNQALDLLVWRPLLIARTAMGVALTAISLPITALTGETEQTARELISDPFKELTEKPLGKGNFIK